MEIGVGIETGTGIETGMGIETGVGMETGLASIPSPLWDVSVSRLQARPTR